MRCYWVILMVQFLLLNGCALRQVKPVSEYRFQENNRLYSKKSWAFEGRMAIQSDAESFSADINWRHGLSGDSVELSGPLGQGRVVISVLAEEIVVDDGDRRVHYTQSPESVFYRYFGVSVPVLALRFWFLGLIEPNQSYKEVKQGFIQHRWQVVYKQMQIAEGTLLPRKIVIEKTNTKIKLIIDRWKLM